VTVAELIWKIYPQQFAELIWKIYPQQFVPSTHVTGFKTRPPVASLLVVSVCAGEL
jgi:hypothetical protein